MYRILESVEAMDWVSAHQGPAADCGGGGLLLPTLPPIHRTCALMSWGSTLDSGVSHPIIFHPFYPLLLLIMLITGQSEARQSMGLFLGILCTLLAANQCFHSIFSQKWFSWNYFTGINILLLLFQLSLIKTKQQTPLTLIDGKGYLHFLWGQASNWPGGDQECVQSPLSAGNMVHYHHSS